MIVKELAASPHITQLQYYARLKWRHLHILAGLDQTSLDIQQCWEAAYQHCRTSLPHLQQRPFEYPFEHRDALTIAGALHRLATCDILVEAWDDSYPRQELMVGWERIRPPTYDVHVVFAVPQTGVLLLYPHCSAL